MQTNIHLHQSEALEVTALVFPDSPKPWGSIVLRDGGSNVTLYLSWDQLSEIGNKVQDAMRGDDDVVETTSDAVTSPVCDHCGEPVESDGDVTDNVRSEWWKHVSGTYRCANQAGSRLTTQYMYAEVGGSISVCDYVPSSPKSEEPTPEQLVCDNCGGAVMVFGARYKHIDPNEGEDGTGWFGCSQSNGGPGDVRNCSVNGRDEVPRKGSL
jgi:hypothetical protein